MLRLSYGVACFLWGVLPGIFLGALAIEFGRFSARRTAAKVVWPGEFDPEKESLEQYRDRLFLSAPILSGGAYDTLIALRKVTFDGDVPCKSGRDELVQKGLAVRWNGFQVVTRSGMAMLQVIKRLEEMDRMKLCKR